jgi:hypothetical protein
MALEERRGIDAAVGRHFSCGQQFSDSEKQEYSSAAVTL